jgi:hypothetical protein
MTIEDVGKFLDSTFCLFSVYDKHHGCYMHQLMYNTNSPFFCQFLST